MSLKIGVLGASRIAELAIVGPAHELGHKKEHLERWFARIALAPCGYGHFFIEHNRGHHVRVATPDDPASSRLQLKDYYRETYQAKPAWQGL